MSNLTPTERALLRAGRGARKAERRMKRQLLQEKKAQQVTYSRRNGDPYLRYVQHWEDEPTSLVNSACSVTVTAEGHRQWKVVTELRQPNTYHIDWFWRHHQATIGAEKAYQFFPNTKGISESVAAYRWVTYRHQLLGDTVLVVGDGTRPRTGSVFAGDPSHPRVYSVDPLMYPQYYQPGAQLQGFALTVEQWLEQHGHLLTEVRNLTIVAVHSHAVLHEYLPTIQALLPATSKVTIVAIPCCVPQQLPVDQDFTLLHEGLDWGIWSDKRLVKLWTSV
jgi:hypothetical protein